MIGRVAGVWTLRPGGDPGDPCAHVHAVCDAWFHARVAFHPAGVGQDQGLEVGGQHSATRMPTSWQGAPLIPGLPGP